MDNDFIKKRSECGIVKLKGNILKKLKCSDGLFSQCKSCVIERQRIYNSENREIIINRSKDYRVKHHDKIMAQKKIYTNSRYRTDINFRLICKTRVEFTKP